MRREDGLEPNVFCYLAAAGVPRAPPASAAPARRTPRCTRRRRCGCCGARSGPRAGVEGRRRHARGAGGARRRRRRRRRPPSRPRAAGGDDGDTPRGRTHRTAMTALRDEGAGGLLHASLAAQMRRGVRPSERSIELVLSALVSAREWRLARSALGRLAESGVPAAAHVKALCDGEGGAAVWVRRSRSSSFSGRGSPRSRCRSARPPTCSAPRSRRRRLGADRSARPGRGDRERQRARRRRGEQHRPEGGSGGLLRGGAAIGR